MKKCLGMNNEGNGGQQMRTSPTLTQQKSNLEVVVTAFYSFTYPSVVGTICPLKAGI